MADKTTNYNLTKPSGEDFYDVKVQNDNMDIIDGQLKGLHDNLDSVDTQLQTVNDNANNLSTEVNETKINLNKHLGESNPHGITASTVGLGNVPNVATNDQTPTYEETAYASIPTLSSGEKLSAVLQKIRGAMSLLKSHLAHTFSHNNADSGYGGGAIGTGATSTRGGGAIGDEASTTYGGAVGKWTKAGSGFAGGNSAKAIDASGNGIDAIQLGTGTNKNPKTLKVYDYELMDANGFIPTERMYGLLKTISFTTPISRTSTTSGEGQRFNTQLTGVDFSAYDDILIVINGTITYPAASNATTSNNNIYAYITSLADNDGAVFAYFTQQHSTSGYTLALNNYQLKLDKSNYSKIETSSSKIYETHIKRCAMNYSSIARFTDDIYIGFRMANANTASYTVIPNLTISIYGRGVI